MSAQGDFQAAATLQGKAFEDAVCTLLRIEGWQIVDRHVVVDGAEVDIVATDPDGVTWWIECKGSWRGDTPGSVRGDTVKKALGVAWLLSLRTDRPPYMLVTSHLPHDQTLGQRMLKEAVTAGLFTEIRTLAFVPWAS